MGMDQFGGLQVKAVALPIAERGLDPETFAPSAPGMTVRRLVQGHVARKILVGRPIGNQIDRAKGVLSGKGHILKITPLTVGHSDGPQRLPVACSLTKQRI